MASFKFNPFTANFDIVDNNELQQARAVYVDSRFGNDSTGIIERQDRPFLTINAAWTAMQSSSVRNNCIFYIGIGSYTLTGVLSDSAWGVFERNITFVCEGEPHQTVITQSSATPVFTITASSQLKKLSIIGGTWIRTGITSTVMFNIASSDNSEFRMKNANIDDQGGTGSVFFQRTTDLLDDCIVSCNNNPSVFQASGTNTSSLRIVKTRVNAPTVSEFITSGTVRDFTIEDSIIDIPSGIICSSIGNVQTNFIHSIINHSGIAIEGRALKLRAKDTKFASITNAGQMMFNTAARNGYLIVDGLYLERPDTAIQDCIRRSGSGMMKAYIHGRGLYYSERTPPTVGSDPVLSNTGPNGRVGFTLGSAQVGNNVTINLPGAGSMQAGSPYNSAPINYVFTSTVIATELTAMKALVDAQVLIAGTPWNIWCQGDTSLVRIIGNSLVIIAHPFVPGYFTISTTTNYSSDTLGDIVNNANTAADGIVDLIGGPQYPLIDTPGINGDIDYPEAVIGPIVKVRNF